MKKLYWKSRTLLLALSMGIIILASTSCSSTKSMPVVQSNDTTSFFQRSTSVDTVYLRDSVFVSDSVVMRERTIHDTVYITKEVYRDRLEARGERQKAVRTDTVVVTDYRDRVVKLPPERYVPKFYRWCTIALWAIGLLAIGNLPMAALIRTDTTEDALVAQIFDMFFYASTCDTKLLCYLFR